MIEQLIAETTDCDFKEAVERAKPKSWLKSVSAFANTKGGALIFGVTDGGHDVVGIADAQSDADFVSQEIRSRLDPVPPFEVGVEQRDSATALVVTVPEGKDSPYYYHADGRMEAYVRVGNRRRSSNATQPSPGRRPTMAGSSAGATARGRSRRRS